MVQPGFRATSLALPRHSHRRVSDQVSSKSSFPSGVFSAEQDLFRIDRAKMEFAWAFGRRLPKHSGRLTRCHLRRDGVIMTVV